MTVVDFLSELINALGNTIDKMITVGMALFDCTPDELSVPGTTKEIEPDWLSRQIASSDENFMQAYNAMRELTGKYPLDPIQVHKSILELTVKSKPIVQYLDKINLSDMKEGNNEAFSQRGCRKSAKNTEMTHNRKKKIDKTS